MKEIHIFVTTDRPDQYLNSIVHCILEEEVKKIVFVQVEDNRIEQINLNLLKTNVYNLLQNLSMGAYKYFSEGQEGKVIQLDAIYKSDELARIKSKYNLCLTDSVTWDATRIPYSELRKYMSALGRNKGTIVDVTSVSKLYISDILACSLMENVFSLYTFQFVEKPNYSVPWENLIHELDVGKDYKYLNLADTPIFKEINKSVLIKTVPLLGSLIGTVIFVTITLVAALLFGFSSLFLQAMSAIGTVLGIISFFLVYFPVRGK